MEIRIAVDIELPRWAKRWMVLAAPMLVVGTTVLARADVELPADYADGDALTAAGLNDRFHKLKDAVDKPVVTVGGISYSLGAVYKGSTGSRDGKFETAGLSGYAAAKSLCEDAVGSPTAHMCTSEEAVRSAQMGISFDGDGGWISTGTNPTASSTFSPVHWTGDCMGWTTDIFIHNENGESAQSGTIMNGNHLVASTGCADLRPILCCD